MTRRMSCSLTIDAVRARTKTVTRRHVNTWTTLKAGDRLTLVEKAMGLPKGARQVVLAEVEVIDVRVEPLVDVTDTEVVAEGFAGMPVEEFVGMWLDSHRHRTFANQTEAHQYMVRRIEWRYLDRELLLPISRVGDELAVITNGPYVDAWRVDDDKAILFGATPGDVRFLHRCDRTPQNRGVIICAPSLQIGNGHTIVTRDPLTIVASIACPDCGTHGWVTAGEWVGA